MAEFSSSSTMSGSSIRPGRDSDAPLGGYPVRNSSHTLGLSEAPSTPRAPHERALREDTSRPVCPDSESPRRAQRLLVGNRADSALDPRSEERKTYNEDTIMDDFRLNGIRNRHARITQDGQESDAAFPLRQLPGQIDDEEFYEAYRLLRGESFLEEQLMPVQSPQNEWIEAEAEDEEPLNIKVERLERQNAHLTSRLKDLEETTQESVAKLEATQESVAKLEATQESVAELEARCNSYQSRLEDIERFMDRDITEPQDTDREEDRREERPVSRHAGRGLSLNTAVHSSDRGLSPAVDSADELETLRPRTARSSNRGRRRLVTEREQLGQDPTHQDEGPRPKRRKPNVLSAPWGPLDVGQVLEANYNPEPIPAAVWDQLRSQIARWTGLRKDWSRGPRRGQDDAYAERWASRARMTRPSKRHACQYCERHRLVCVVLGSGTVQLCPVRAENDELGPSDVGYWVRAVEE
ncbi:hypothetical protein G7Y79_00038g074690 [Physcia stellaris]|nr:hypothetical protein G7Y79_00038g074690 [Physcia stellaris]